MVKEAHTTFEIKSVWRTITSELDRYRIKASQTLGEIDRKGILRRLLLDERISQSSEDTYRKLGFVHLVSATGIHLYALSSLVFYLVRYLHSLFPNRLLIYFAYFASGVVFILSWSLSGLRAGMLRPWLIVVMRLAIRGFGGQWRLYYPLILALVLDIAVGEILRWLDVGYPWGWGRVHYALAVGGGLMCIDLFRAMGIRPNPFWFHLGLSVGSWLPTAVWDALTIGLVATFTPLISLLTIPLYTAAIYPGLMLGILFERQSLLLWASQLSDWLVNVLSQVTVSFQTVFTVSQLSALLSVVFALIFVIVSRKTQMLIFIVLLTVRFIPYRSSALRIEQLDVGQGDAAVIFADRAGTGMIDVGSNWALSDSAWMEILSSRRIDRLDWILLTHMDEDHRGGLERLLRLVPIGCIHISRGEAQRISKKQWQSIRKSEAVVSRPCYPFQLMHAKSSTKKGNSDMYGTIIPIEEGYFVSLGDMSSKFELQVAREISRAWNDSKRRILKLSHHGSRYSTSLEFIRLVRPTDVIVSSGTGNRYGHPNWGVLNRVQAQGIRIRRTDLDGSVNVSR